MNPDDTIVAISSAAGAAARGIVRVSGPAAMDVASGVFDASSATAWPPDTAVMPPQSAVMSSSSADASCDPAPRNAAQASASKCVEGFVRVGRFRLPGFALVFRAPRSYTAQDVVELHFLGAPVLLGWVVEACIAAGARRAEPGEFTLRAVLAGRMDLSQAHGVAGMIAARSDMQLRAAERLLHGELSRVAGAARERLADLLSLVEGALDFAEEPIEFITPGQLRDGLMEMHKALAATTAAGVRAERWDQLPRVVLAGRPNAGKSSLLNRMTGLDRAICAPVAGTTRDVLSAPLRLGETECLLIDVAGVGDAVDTLDAQAQRAARDALKSADLVVWLEDVTESDPARRAESPVSDVPCLLVGNKCDLPGAPRAAKATGYDLLVSATTGAGLDELKTALAARLQDRESAVSDSAVALMSEHRAALDSALEALDRAIGLATASCETLADADLVAAELRSVAEELGVLAGREDMEDLLGRIFSRFCVGK